MAIDETFEWIYRMEISDLKIIFYREGIYQKGPYMPDNGILKEFDDAHDTICKLIKDKNRFENLTQHHKSKLIILQYFLNIPKNQRCFLEESEQKLLMNHAEVFLPNNSTMQEINKLQLFYALHYISQHEERKIEKITWDEVKSEWGPKIVIKDVNEYRTLYYYHDNFEELVSKYNIAAQLGATENHKPNYNIETIETPKHLIWLKINDITPTVTLSHLFRNLIMDSNEEGIGVQFESIMKLYFGSSLETISVDNKDICLTLPRLSEQVLRQYSKALGNHIVLPKIRGPSNDNKWYHIVHGDEWGDNFLVGKDTGNTYFLDFEDSLFVEVNGKQVEAVGGDLSSRIFYKTKSNDTEKYSLYGLSLFASLGRLLAALIQHESKPYPKSHEICLEKKHIMSPKLIEMVVRSFICKCENKIPKSSSEYSTSFITQILLSSWDWATYWSEKGKFHDENYNRFVEVIQTFLANPMNICKKNSETSEQGEKESSRMNIKYNIKGNKNIQINARDDVISSIGDGAMAAGRDIIIHKHGIDPDEYAEKLAKIIHLEEQLKRLNEEKNEERQKVLAKESTISAEKMKQDKHIEFSSDKLIELGKAAQLAGRLEIAEGNFKQALRKFENDDDRQGEGSSLNHLGIIAKTRGDLVEAERLYRESLAIMREVGNRQGEANSLSNLGNIAETLGELGEAERLVRESLATFKEIGDRQGEANSLGNLGNIADIRGDLVEAERLYRESLAINREIGNRQGEGSSLNNLGNIANTRGNLVEAERLYQESLVLMREIGSRKSEASSLNNLGNIAETRGYLDEAERLHRESLTIKREIGDREGEANSLGSLGLIAKIRGDLAEAERLDRESLAIFREIGSRISEANSLNNLGNIAETRGNLAEAERFLLESLAIFKEIGDRQGEANSLGSLGAIAITRGDLTEAERLFRKSLAIMREVGGRKGEANSLISLGTIAGTLGDLTDSERLFQKSLAIFREIGSRQGEAYSLNNLGNLAESLGDLAKAERLLRASLAIMRDVGDRKGEACSLNNLGNITKTLGDLAEAERLHRESLTIERGIGNRLGEAHSLNNLGIIAQIRGDLAEAERLHRKSLTIEREIGNRLGEADSLNYLGIIAGTRGNLAEAERLFAESAVIKLEIGRTNDNDSRDRNE